MIGTEVAVFAALFGAGLGAGLLAAVLLALGRGSRIARAVCDLVTPPVVGVLFFLTLRAVASGVFRLYSAVAFLLGGTLAILLARRSAPLLSRMLNRAKVPIKSLENRVSRRLSRLFAPIAQRRAARKKKRVERRAATLRESGDWRVESGAKGRLRLQKHFSQLHPIIVAEMGCGAKSSCKRSAQGHRERAYERYDKARRKREFSSEARQSRGSLR